MVALDITETSKALSVTGGYIASVGLFSYYIKEKLFICKSWRYLFFVWLGLALTNKAQKSCNAYCQIVAEALLALLAGVLFGPLAANFFSPLSWVSNDEESLHNLTHQVTRIVIAIQVLFTGISLPKAYLRTEWLSLTTLLGPIMLAAWFVTALLIWGLIPGLTFLECLVVAACVTPTDPVLANSICKGWLFISSVECNVTKS